MKIAILYFLLSISAGAVLTFVFRAFAWKFKIVNQPNVIVPQHVKPIAYLGGLGIYFGILVSLTFAYFFYGHDIPSLLLLFSCLYAALGLMDDLYTFRPLFKFFLQVILALLTAFFCINLYMTGIVIIDVVLSAFWILVLINAFNLTDVCDGLVAGISVCIFLVVATFSDQYYIIPLICAGSTLGFLFFNFPPASIFMGDCGSHLLGFLSAYFTMVLVTNGISSEFMILVPLLCAVPLFELAFLVIVRYRKGLAWWKGSPDHFSLRLQRHGFSKLKTDCIAWGLTLLSFGPLIYFKCSDNANISFLLLMLSILLVIYIYFWYYLIKIESKDNER